jgi:hypothetical protein
MADDSSLAVITLIGDTSGVVWKTLNDKGPMSINKLVKAVDEPRDLVMQALGWLAREGKLSFDGDARNRKVALRP